MIPTVPLPSNHFRDVGEFALHAAECIVGGPIGMTVKGSTVELLSAATGRPAIGAFDPDDPCSVYLDVALGDRDLASTAFHEGIHGAQNARGWHLEEEAAERLTRQWAEAVYQAGQAAGWSRERVRHFTSIGGKGFFEVAGKLFGEDLRAPAAPVFSARGILVNPPQIHRILRTA